jgi:hypothetical protein
MEINENTDENISIMAIMLVNSSIWVVSDLFEKCRDVIIKRQKPKRLAAVLNMCCDVLLGIFVLI